MPIETITKNKRKRYRWTFNRVISGSRVRQTKLLPEGISAAEADGLARRWEAEIYAIENGERKATITIGQCVRKHLADKSHTWKDRRGRILALEKWSAEYADQDATDLHDWSISFAEYLRSSTDRLQSPKVPVVDGTIRNILSYLRAAIKYAHKSGFLSIDQTVRMVMPNASKARHNYPQRKQMLQLARKCRDREVRAAIRIAFYSGMRRAEILRAIPTPKGFDLATSKNGRPRIIPIHPRIAVLTRNIKFTISERRFSSEWDKTRALAGFPNTRFHDLRHSAASEMINAGIDILTVGKVLGHTSITSTQRYSHLLTDTLSGAVNKIGNRRK